jgi:hypothetical protein
MVELSNTAPLGDDMGKFAEMDAGGCTQACIESIGALYGRHRFDCVNAEPLARHKQADLGSLRSLVTAWRVRETSDLRALGAQAWFDSAAVCADQLEQRLNDPYSACGPDCRANLCTDGDPGGDEHQECL